MRDEDVAYLLAMAAACERIENTSGDARILRRIAERLLQEDAWPELAPGRLYGLFALGDGKMRIYADPSMPPDKVELRDHTGSVLVVMNNTGKKGLFARHADAAREEQL